MPIVRCPGFAVPVVVFDAGGCRHENRKGSRRKTASREYVNGRMMVFSGCKLGKPKFAKYRVSEEGDQP